MTTKQIVLQAFDRLPDDATIDEVIERLHFLHRFTEAMRQADADEDLMDHEDFKQGLRETLNIELE